MEIWKKKHRGFKIELDSEIFTYIHILMHGANKFQYTFCHFSVQIWGWTNRFLGRLWKWHVHENQVAANQCFLRWQTQWDKLPLYESPLTVVVRPSQPFQINLFADLLNVYGKSNRSYSWMSVILRWGGPPGCFFSFLSVYKIKKLLESAIASIMWTTF